MIFFSRKFPIPPPGEVGLPSGIGPPSRFRAILALKLAPSTKHAILVSEFVFVLASYEKLAPFRFFKTRIWPFSPLEAGPWPGDTILSGPASPGGYNRTKDTKLMPLFWTPLPREGMVFSFFQTFCRCIIPPFQFDDI